MSVRIVAVPLRLARWCNIAKRVLILTAAVPVMTLAGTVDAAGSGDSRRYRAGFAGDQFGGTSQISASFDLDVQQPFRADRIEFSVGLLGMHEDIRPFLALGPVWRGHLRETKYFLELSISPTLLVGSTFGGERLGGNFHFTSAFTIGRQIGRAGTGYVGLRLQHISNAGLDSTNPGMDMVGIDFRFHRQTRE